MAKRSSGSKVRVSRGSRGGSGSASSRSAGAKRSASGAKSSRSASSRSSGRSGASSRRASAGKAKSRSGSSASKGRGRASIAKFAKKGAAARQRMAGRKPGSAPLTERNSGTEWNDIDILRLRELVSDNTPTRLIGLQMGRTEDAVYAKASELGLSLKPTNQSPRG